MIERVFYKIIIGKIIKDVLGAHYVRLTYEVISDSAEANFIFDAVVSEYFSTTCIQSRVSDKRFIFSYKLSSRL